jgi:hypothetical protein
MRLLPHELFIQKLRKRLRRDDRLDRVHRMTNEQCFAELRRLSDGQDFGRDVNAWAKWFREQQKRERREDDEALEHMAPEQEAAWRARVDESDRRTLEAFAKWFESGKTPQDEAALLRSLGPPPPRPSEVKTGKRKATKR